MEFSQKTKQYWDKDDLEKVNKVISIEELYTIAKKIVTKMPKPIVQVCGPISTGGQGSIEANLNLFNQTILSLQAQDLSVFDQMPFEESMARLSLELRAQGKYDNSILTDFYFPLFESGNISTFYFLPNWQSSVGARAEHQKAEELGIKIIYL
jgi:hypothetical protein